MKNGKVNRGKYYWKCVNSSCDAEWYSDNPEDHTCPKCGLERCANSMHPDDFDKLIKTLCGEKDENNI